MNYLELLSPHQRNRPRFAALATAVLAQAEDFFALLDSLPEALSPERAVGAQLDRLGALCGVPRPAGHLSEEDYRTYLRAKIALHHWDGTNETVPEVLRAAFPDRDAALRDNLDGTVTASLSGDPLPFPLKEVFPVPAGVRLIES